MTTVDREPQGNLPDGQNPEFFTVSFTRDQLLEDREGNLLNAPCTSDMRFFLDKTDFIRGFAIVRAPDGHKLNIFEESSQVAKEQASRWIPMYRMVGSFKAKFTDLKGRPIEEAEEEFSQTIAKDPEKTIVGFVRISG